MPKDYNKVYSKQELYWGSQPSELVRKFAELTPSGKALDLGMGEGRDVLYLASQGFEVTGVESANSGCTKCLEIAQKQGFSIKTVCSDVREYKIARKKYAIITTINLFQFISKTEAADLIEKISAGLKKDGLFLCQTFTYDDPSYKVRKRKSKEIEPGVFVDGSGNVSSLYDYCELLALASDLRVIYYTEYDFYDLKHGKPHWHGVVDFVGKKI